MFWLLGLIKPIHYLIVAGVISITALGFYGRKVYLEKRYKISVEKDKKSFASCVKEAKTSDKIQKCFEKINKTQGGG